MNITSVLLVSPICFSPLRSLSRLINLIYLKHLEGEGKGALLVRPTTTTLWTPSTHRTFVQRMTLPKIVLQYYKQWQTKGNENSRQIVLPPDQGYLYGIPHHNIFFLIHFCIGLHNTCI